MRIDAIGNGSSPTSGVDLTPIDPVTKPTAVGPQRSDDPNKKMDVDRVELSPQGKQAELNKALEKISKTAEVFSRHLQFEIHDKTKEIMVKIIDSDTGQVLDEIPSKKLLDIMAGLQELVGQVVDKKG